MKRAALLILLLSCTSCAAVPPQHVGVVEVFGAVQDQTWAPGPHLWFPWQGVHRINCRTVQAEEKTQTPTSEGLLVGLDVSVVYHVQPEMAKEVFSRYGGTLQLFDQVMRPEIRSTIRDVTAAFKAVDLYSGARERVANMMFQELSRRLEGRGVEVEAVLLRDIGLPQQLSQAVEQKLAAEQEAQRMEFILARERQEAERKRIEAQGVADFQRIVAQGISEQLLRWKGIEATRELVQSQNAKVIVVGGKDGLPIIFNAER